MNIKDLIPFNWKREKPAAELSVPVRQNLPATDWFGSVERDLDRLFEQFFGPSFGLSPALSPAINVRETAATYQVDVELPGMAKEDIDVRLDDRYLVLSGRREERTSGQARHREIRYGSFQRVLPLPSGVRVENPIATYRNGVLEITLQKEKEVVSGGTQIPVTAG